MALKEDTILVSGGYTPKKHNRSVIPPIYQSTAFRFESAKDISAVFQGQYPGSIYSRISNPTVEILERRLNILENGIGAIAVSSGMSAISSVILGLCSNGGEIISGNSLFGGTASLFKNILTNYNINTKFFNPTQIDNLENIISDNSRLIFIETIGNPKLDIPDIKKISEIADKNNIPLVVDATCTPPISWCAGNFGASIVIHSTTKYINGNSTAIGGIIVDTGKFNWANSRLKNILDSSLKQVGRLAFLHHLKTTIIKEMGFIQTPQNAFLTLSGMETLSLRYKQICRNAEYIAQRLSEDKRIISVNYPGLEKHPQRNLVDSQFGGLGGGLLTINLKDQESCFRFLSNLRIISILANIGDTRTLAIHPKSTILHNFSDKEAETFGVNDTLIRFSIGIEDKEDLISDFNYALKESVL